MNAQEALDRAYAASPDPAEQQALFDAWAASYDRDLIVSGYAAPGRIAAAVATHLADRSAPILDFGCGTGMAGRALGDVGFDTIDGVDLSVGMLDVARRSGVYRHLTPLAPGELDVGVGEHRAIVACGVISPSAAPASTLGLIGSVLGPGDLMVVTLTDDGLNDTEYADALESLLDDDVEQLAAERGVHIASRESESVVYVLRRR